MVVIQWRRAQSNVELMLYISVITIALAVAAFAFIGPLDEGYDAMEADAEEMFRGAQQTGSGDER